VALVIPPSVLKQLRSMPKADRDRIFEALEQVAQNPTARFPFTTELKGEAGAWRLRKGDWRAVYTIEGQDIVVRAVAHRREVYR
jgi:mRNA-degrading endonuclease RelE of RelBE toxin-antitoxin system